MHVARQHHQLGAFGLDDLQLPRLGLGLGVGRDRDVVKGHVVAGGQLVELAVVAHDGADVQRQQARLPAEQQVVQAMAFLADHEHRAHGLAGGVQLPAHLKALRKSPQLLAQRAGVQRAGELHPHEEQAGVVVVVLGRLFDVAAALEQKAGDGVHDAGAVGAGEGQDIGRAHGVCGAAL